jgi:hypothetical protein
MIAPSLHVEGAKKRFFYWVEVSTLGGNTGHGYYETNPQK